MGKPITTTAGGVCFAFPDVCLTPTGGPPAPIPYPNIGSLLDTTEVSSTVFVMGEAVVHSDSSIADSTGDEAGSNGGVGSGQTKGEVKFTSASTSVFVDSGKGVVRMFDSTTQNGGNAVGTVLGGVPTVLVGD